MGQHPVHGAGSLGEGSPVSDTQAPRSGPPIVRPRTQPPPRRPDWPTMLWRSCSSGVQVRQGTACWVTALPCSLQLAPWAKENAPAALPSCGLPRMGPAQGGPGLSTSPGPHLPPVPAEPHPGPGAAAGLPRELKLHKETISGVGSAWPFGVKGMLHSPPEPVHGQGPFPFEASGE